MPLSWHRLHTGSVFDIVNAPLQQTSLAEVPAGMQCSVAYVCCADVQVTQESREAEDIQATVAEEEQIVGNQTAETAALKGKLEHIIDL